MKHRRDLPVSSLLTVTEQIAVLDGRDTRAARERRVTTLLERLGEALD